MLLQVHDELLFEVPEDEAEAHGRAGQGGDGGGRRAAWSTLSVPLVVETGWAKSWDEAH